MLILVASALALYLVWRIRGVIQLVGVSLFFALALFPVVDAIAIRTGAPRALVILAVYLILAVVVALIGYVVIPSLVRELHMLSRDAPHYAAQLRHNAITSPLRIGACAARLGLRVTEQAAGAANQDDLAPDASRGAGGSSRCRGGRRRRVPHRMVRRRRRVPAADV